MFATVRGRKMLERINNDNEDFVVVLPQHAFTGTNLVSLDTRHFFRAAAILEYERLSKKETPCVWHKQGPPSEHFEQLALDLSLLFIPVDYPLRELPFVVAPNAVVGVDGDVLLACDKERGISWGRIENIASNAKEIPIE